MIVNGIDLSQVKEKHSGPKLPEQVKGRVLHIDADFLAYMMSYEKVGNIIPFEDMQFNCSGAIEKMRLMAGAQAHPVAETEILGEGDLQGLLVSRFDRVVDGASVQRLHQEDFAQALGLGPHLKYQRNGTPSRCFSAAMPTGTAASPKFSSSSRARSWPRSPGGPGTSPAAVASAAARWSTGSAGFDARESRPRTMM